MLNVVLSRCLSLNFDKHCEISILIIWSRFTRKVGRPISVVTCCTCQRLGPDNFDDPGIFNVHQKSPRHGIGSDVYLPHIATALARDRACNLELSRPTCYQPSSRHIDPKRCRTQYLCISPRLEGGVDHYVLHCLCVCYCSVVVNY